MSHTFKAGIANTENTYELLCSFKNNIAPIYHNRLTKIFESLLGSDDIDSKMRKKLLSKVNVAIYRITSPLYDPMNVFSSLQTSFDTIYKEGLPNTSLKQMIDNFRMVWGVGINETIQRHEPKCENTGCYVRYTHLD